MPPARICVANDQGQLVTLLRVLRTKNLLTGHGSFFAGLPYFFMEKTGEQVFQTGPGTFRTSGGVRLHELPSELQPGHCR